MIWAHTSPLWLPVLMLVAYAIGIQYERGGWWRVFWIVAGPATVLDFVLAHTLFAIYIQDCPRKGEWLFSQQLGRLVRKEYENDWCGTAALVIARVLNWLAPSSKHVPMAEPDS